MNHTRPQRRALAVAALLAACALLLVSPAQSASSGAARAQGEQGRASVIFTALDKAGNFVRGLKAEDVRVSVDGAPQETLALSPQTNAPLFLAVVLDTSASQERLLEQTKVAADIFVRAMMVAGADKAAVVTFAHETVLEQEMTGEVEKVRAAIARVKLDAPPGYAGGGVVVGNTPNLNGTGQTGVWNALWLVSRDVLSRSLGPGRRAVLVVTDGVDTSSRMKLKDAVESALQSEAVVYAIGVGDDKYFDGVDKTPLRKLTEQTGGRAFFPKKMHELAGIFTRVSEELSSQYVLTFVSPAPARDGSFHKVRIELANKALRDAGVALSYPQGFYAGNASTAVRK